MLLNTRTLGSQFEEMGGFFWVGAGAEEKVQY